jgi:hypothetical protein
VRAIDDRLADRVEGVFTIPARVEAEDCHAAPPQKLDEPEILEVSGVAELKVLVPDAGPPEHLC